MRKLFYLGYYDGDENTAQCRNFVRSATTKMDYISEKLVEIGQDIQIVSMSGTKGRKYVVGKNYINEAGVRVKLFPSLGSGGPLKRRLARALMEKQLFHYLLGLTSEDTLLVYHSLGYADIVRRAKAKRNFKLVLEIEEFYSDVTGSEKDAKLEKAFFDSADAYICSTELISEHFAGTGKRSAICYGVYKMSKRVATKQSDGAIHVVYAGTLDPRKGGAAAAAAAGALLDSNYHVHILGFGRDREVEEIRKAVEDANKASSGAVITYDGYLTGKTFEMFIQSCHIGLSPQDPSGDFNYTSFPSKVFMYLTNGLPVVSVELPVFRRNCLRSVLFLSKDNSPASISNAIASVPRDVASPEGILIELDHEFKNALKRVIEGLWV